MSDLQISHKGGPIVGEIVLGGSKSITNRAYIIRALCQQTFDISNASNSDDSQSLLRLLNQKEGVLDAGHAGTTFR
ncbi:MAG: 3-phosphoshikimate 1-carboxyvinyltransferase, partial [Saprospiraceae bacterium]|nr:3-phosphoshikimate 1-carboxyvinyltransferase [Saprospiraceae bacterium]